MPKGEHVNERTEADSFCALRSGCHPGAGARTLGETHIEVVFGDKIVVHARLVQEFHHFEMTSINFLIG